MNKFAHTRAVLTSVLLLLSCWATLGAAETGSSQSIETGLRDHVIPDQYIVLFRDRVAKPRWLASELAQRYGFRSRHVFRSVLHGFVAKMPQWVARALARLPDVAIVEPDLVATEAQQTIPEGITRISADLNPLAGIDGIDDRRVNVGIAIIDGGIDLDHQDLNVVWAVDCTGENGCVENTGAPGDLTGNDVRGHGTHVAGTIGALDNGFGVVGVAPGARLAAVKVLGDDGRGTFSDVIAGIDWVAEHSDFIAVANLSLEGVGYLSTLRQAVQRAVDAGVVLVVAAGNADRDILGTDGVINSSPPSESFYCRYVSRSYCKSDTIPAAYPEVATVSATDISNNGIADFSNYAANSENDLHGVPVISEGGAIDLTAPGVSILSSAVNDDTETRSGTSMAAPHVAGAAALYIAETGGRDVNFDGAVNTADVYAIRQALIDSAQAQDDYPSADPDNRTEAMAYAGGDSVQPLIASFSHECNYLSCDFADTSTAVESTITSWGWDFGDGNVSTDQNPSHTYAAGDTYTVTLTVSNGAGDVDTFTAEVQVTPNAAPTADFSYSCDALACSFTDASSDLDGAIESRSWNFGDGASANDATPSHAYTTAGAYTVTLTVTDNADDSSQIAKTVSVSAPNQQPVARFSASPTSGEAPLQVGFDATASSDGDGTITSYSWDFGDGTGGSGVTPSHTYAAGGPYTVTLTVTDDDGAEGTATASISVTASNQQPVARFSANPTSGEAPLQVGFDATASSDGDGTITSYSWDFGDGTGGSGVTPSHTYAAGGSYTVTLTVTDDDGAEGTATAPITVHQPTGQDSVHVADLDAKTQRYWSWWWATVTVTVRDQQGNPVGGARVTGAWSAIGGATSCDTSSSGVCSLRSNLAGSQVSSLTLRVTDIAAAGYAYEPAANMDPDGDSDGTELTVSR